jgi:SynChlorMet cassette radical SAM/SPASM protein ScmE
LRLHPGFHDVFRGQGAFFQALAGIQFLQKYDLPLTVRVTIHRENVHQLEEIARFLLEEVGLPSFSTNAASHMGLCRRNAERTQLTPQEHALAMETLLSLADAYPGRISATAGPLADGRTWLSMEQARRDKRPPLGNAGFLTGCNGPMKTLAVRADGIYVPCLQLSHMALGHIDRDDLSRIWQGHPHLQRLRERSSIPLTSFPFCRECPYIPYCTGNCPATAFTFTGEINHPSPDACLRRFLERGGRLPDRLFLDPEG